MKIRITFLVLIMSIYSFAQQDNFTDLEGKILVESNDVEGITIYNSTGKKGTITNVQGEFTIPARLNDSIQVRALQYQDFNIVVNQAMIDNKTLQIYLIEEINELDEILVKENELTGDLTDDMELFSPKSNALYFGFNKNQDISLEDQVPTQTVENTVMHSQGQTMVNGLNIKNVVDQLLIPLFRSEVNNKKEKGIPDVPANSVKYYFGSQFLTDNFNIPAHRVEEFIRFVEAEDFNFSLLNYGKEMQLLEVINKKSKVFLKKRP